MKALDHQSLTSIFESMYMQHESEIEIQLWDYLDGTCSVNDRQRMVELIAHDAMWKQKFAELSALHQTLNTRTELAHPGMRFSQNVMDVIAQEHIVPSAKTYLNKWVIGSIAALFILVVCGLLLSAANAPASEHNTRWLPDFSRLQFDTSGFSFHTFLYGFLMLQVMAALLLVDALLKRRKAAGAH
jgi:hypothetical protein